MFAGNMFFRAIIGTGKKELFEAISPKFSKKKKNVSSDTLTSAGPLRKC